MKREQIKAGGGQLMEQKTKKKNHLPIHFDLEVKEETHPIRTLLSPLVNLNNTQLLHWLNSFPHTLPDPISPPSVNFLCWLLECHKSHQLPLSLQQAYWPELLELEYPQEGHNLLTQSETPSEVEECWVEGLLETQEEQDHQGDLLLEDQMTTQIPEEGEIQSYHSITPTIGSQIN
jgi:hypothetical protein